MRGITGPALPDRVPWRTVIKALHPFTRAGSRIVAALAVACAAFLAAAGCGGGGGGLFSVPGDPAPGTAAVVGGVVFIPASQAGSAAPAVPGAGAPARAPIPDGFAPLAGATVTLGRHATTTDALGRFRIDLPAGDPAIGASGGVEVVVASGRDLFPLRLEPASGATVVAEVRVDLARRTLIAVAVASEPVLPPAIGLDPIGAILGETLAPPEDAAAFPPVVTGRVNRPDAEFLRAETVIVAGFAPGRPGVVVDPPAADGWHAYRIEGLPAGPADLSCRSAGYVRVTRPIDLSAGRTYTNVDFRLVPVASLDDLSIRLDEGGGQEARVGEPAPRAVGFRVTDAAGLPVAGVTVSFAVTGGGGSLDASETLPGIQAEAVSGADGRAWCDRWILGEAPGPQELTASIPSGRLRAATAAAAAKVGLPAALALAPGPVEVACGLARPFTARVTDRFGNPVPSVAVGFALPAAPPHAQPALFTPAQAFTGESGEAGSALTLSAAVGVHGVRVFVSATLEARLEIVGVPGAPESVRFEPAGPVAVAADAPTVVFSLAVADRFGNAVADGYEVTLAVNDPPPANLGAAGRATAAGTTADGRVSVTLEASTVAGDDYTVSATVEAASGVSGVATVGAAPAVRLELAGAAARTATVAAPVTVTARDAFGNVAVAYAGVRALRFTGPGVSPDGVAPACADHTGRAVPLDGAVGLLFTSGVAEASITLARAAESFDLEVSDGAIGGGGALALGPVVPGPLHRYRVAAPAEAGYRQPFSMTVTPVDAFGNPRAGAAAVALSADGSDGALAVPSADTSAGPATVAAQSYDRAATIAIRAGDGTVGDERVASVRVIPAAANAIRFPGAATAQKVKTVRFELGEAAASARLVWRVTAGPGAGSEHARPLAGGELAAGVHEIAHEDAGSPPLASGAVYTLVLESFAAATGRGALEREHATVLYTTDLPPPPAPAALGHSNRTGKVAVLASGAAAQDQKLRVYFDGELAGETEYLGPGGLSSGDTAFLGLPRRAPGTRIEYATVNRIPGYAVGVESARAGDGVVPAPPDPARLDWSAAFERARVRPGLSGAANTGMRVRLYPGAPGGNHHTQAVPLPDDAATEVASAAFAPAVPALAAGSAVAWSLLDGNDNESDIVADGEIPAPPTGAYLQEMANGADNTRHHVNIASSASPVVAVHPSPGQPVHLRAHALLSDAGAAAVPDGGAGVDNPGDGTAVAVTLPSVAALAPGALAVRAWVRDDAAGHDSPLLTGTPGIRDIVRPTLAELSFLDTDEWDDYDGLIDRVELVFSEPVTTGDGAAPTGALLGRLILPDGAQADLTDALVSDPAGATAAVTARRITGQLVPNTARGALAIEPPATAWRDRAGNGNAADAASGTVYRDLAPPLLLEVRSSASPVNGRMLQDFLLQFVFSEPVRFGANYDPDDLMNLFTDTPGAYWTEGTPDRFDDAPISLQIGPDGSAELHFRFDADSDPFGNWTPGVDDINLLDPQPTDGFEDAAGNDARPAPSHVLIRWP